MSNFSIFLKEKLGLSKEVDIKSRFDPEVFDILWDLLNKKHDSLLSHPKIRSEPDEEWVFFLVVHNVHAAVWAVQDKFLSNLDMLDNEFVTAYDITRSLKQEAIVRRYHVVIGDDDRYYVQPDDLFLNAARPPEFDMCLYIGTLTIPSKGLDVAMAMIADKSYLLLESDCLEYCKNFVYLYFELIETEMTYEQKATLRKLTVTTNILSQTTERSGRQHWLSGLSLRSVLTSTFTQVLIATLLGNVLFWYISRR